MRHAKRITAGLPVQAVLDAIKPAMWAEVTLRQQFPGTAHADTETIYLRGPRSFAAAQDDLTSIPFPASSEPAMQAACEAVLADIPLEFCEVGRAMLVSLKPGGRIERHADEGAYAQRFSRFHVALQSDEGNVFTVGTIGFHMKPGDCWWFQHRVPHEVRNDSERPRIHLIFDARVSGLYAGA